LIPVLEIVVVEMILGIVGSSRKGKLTDQLVSKCLEGVESAGVKAEKTYLVDYAVSFYTENAKCPEELDRLWEEADGLVIGAPVYWGSINGLTKDLMDMLKITDVNGKYGLGISVAGGTGRGLCSSVQAIYRFFYHRRMRGVEPTPVSRFNFEQTIKTIAESGRRLAELSRERKPFEGDKDRMEHYEGLDYLNYTFLDEMILLAGQLVEISRKSELPEAQEEYAAARKLVAQGKRSEAIGHAVKAYNMLYYDPPKA